MQRLVDTRGWILGAATQRITGLGFALIAAPFLVLAAGPHQGVLLANMLSLCTNLVVLAQTWRDVELGHVALLVVPALCLVPVGERVARLLPPGPLMIAIGGLVFVALVIVIAFPKMRIFRGHVGAVGAGALSGFMNVTAGVGGPAMTLYAVSTGWPHRRFVGSMQLYFALLNLGSLAAKGLPCLDIGSFASLAAALGLGLLAGNMASRHVSGGAARRAVEVLALLGAAATVIKGFVVS
jgi:uncharacterized membrane protein YfcA